MLYQTEKWKQTGMIFFWTVCCLPATALLCLGRMLCKIPSSWIMHWSRSFIWSIRSSFSSPSSMSSSFTKSLCTLMHFEKILGRCQNVIIYRYFFMSTAFFWDFNTSIWKIRSSWRSDKIKMILSSWCFLQKTNERIQFYYYETYFRSFLEGNWRHQKDISKLTDL